MILINFNESHVLFVMCLAPETCIMFCISMTIKNCLCMDLYRFHTLQQNILERNCLALSGAGFEVFRVLFVLAQSGLAVWNLF